jgi:hypothetical protein
VPSASSRLDFTPGICNYRVAFVNTCIRGLCQPEQAVSFQRRARKFLPLALHWSVLRTFWVSRYVPFRAAHTSSHHFSRFLTLDFLAVILVFTQNAYLFFCRQRFFDTDELFTKSRHPLFCSPLLTFLNRLCASLHETISFPRFSSSYGINIGVWSTSVAQQKSRWQAIRNLKT